MYKAIDLVIYIIGYCLYLIGLCFLVRPLIIPSLINTVKYTRFRSARNVAKTTKCNPFIEHIDMLLYTVLNKKIHGAAYTFIAISFSLFLVTFALLVKGGRSLLVDLLFAISTGVLPYVVLRSRLIVMRIEGSYEAEALINELNNQYKICNLNMIEAIDKTLPLLNNCRYTQRALFRLAMSIKDYKTDEELDKIIKEFVFAIDTDWAAMLATNIKISVSDGRDVRPSLDDTLEDLKNIKVTLEKDKRYNNEAFSILRFVIPAVYVLSIIAAIKLFGFSLNKFLQYQFNTDLGLKFALVTLVSMAINYIVYYVMRKPKYDF